MAEDPSRKLAVILHADVVGSTTLVQQNETLAHARIQDAFRRLSLNIKAYKGLTRELRGDALVAEFARASDAVTAALAFQKENIESNARLEDDLQPQVRIGISLGEVVIADHTVTGAGVVLAQRVEQLAEPSGVCITGAVHEAVPQRLPLEYSDLGKRELKGFREPVQVYSASVKSGQHIPSPEPAILREARFVKPRHLWIGGAIVLLAVVASMLAWWQPWGPEVEPASVERSAFPLHDKPSIAILPFENLSADPEQEYFADGISDDLITDLSQISNLFVAARLSVFAYKDVAIDIHRIGQELGVRYILEGSVRKAGGRVRINAQLTDTVTGGHIWAKRYDREFADIFDLQDEITGRIVSALAVKLTEREQGLLERRYTDSPEAYDYFLRGQQYYFRLTEEDNARARELYRIAIELDPEFARAYSALAVTYGRPALYGWGDDREQSLEQGLSLAQRAVALDDRLPQVHWALGFIHLLRKQHSRAIAAAEQAIAVDPNYAEGYGLLAWVHMFAGKPQRSIELIEQALRIDPNPGDLFFSVLGEAQYWAGLFDEAASTLEKVVAGNPNVIDGRLALAAVYNRLGRHEEADWEVQEILSLNPNLTLDELARRTPVDDGERLQRLLDDLREAGLE